MRTPRVRQLDRPLMASRGGARSARPFHRIQGQRDGLGIDPDPRHELRKDRRPRQDSSLTTRSPATSPLAPLFGSVVLRGANGINGLGQIVATTFALGAPGSGVRTFVLTPVDVPEPASVMLLGCGVAGIVCVRRKRNRSLSS